MRRSCILFETERTEKNENAYIFLGFLIKIIFIINEKIIIKAYIGYSY